MRMFWRRPRSNVRLGQNLPRDQPLSDAAIAKEGKCPLTLWQKLGFLGFMFFLIKGLLWLLIPAGLLLWRSMSGE